GAWLFALTYVLASFIGGLIMVKFGRMLSNKWLNRGAERVH
ncbi:fluoride efflux transporter CrcB, partial [Listeria monocytogenes]|nr:fluoride efflux transporter CrcB [Listeria monocytogenes]